jgi:undecaprenyl-diphosphatase
MLEELLLAFIQAATEYLPISSSGHLAMFGNFFGNTSLFLFTLLHLASLLAVVVFLRKDLIELFKFKKKSLKTWKYWILATIPAAIIGFIFSTQIESLFTSPLFLAIAFLFTGTILFLTKFIKKKEKKLDTKSSLKIGLIQALALLPGVSRSGMTISAGLFQGIDKEKAARFSFLLFIPLSLGAFILEAIKVETIVLSSSIIISFIACFIFSLLFLNLLIRIIKTNYFWVFSIYCWAIGILNLIFFFL